MNDLERSTRRVLALFTAGLFAAAALSVLLLPKSVLPLFAAGFSLLAAAALLLRGTAAILRRCLLLCCAGAAVGFLWTWSYSQIFLTPARLLDGHTIMLEAEVIDWPTERTYGGSVDVRAALPGGGHASARLYLNKTDAQLRPGDIVYTRARCSFADRMLSGEETNYFTARRILLIAEADGDVTVRRPARLPITRLPAYFARWLKEGIASLCPSDSAPIVTALVTGDRSGLDRVFTAALRRTGLSHIVAVSGMHMAFLVALLGLLPGIPRRIKIPGCILVTSVFAMMTGGTPSVVRAAVMVDLFMIAPIFGRERDDLTALSAALLLLLIQNPFAVADAGLQLSFAAVLGILLFSTRATNKIISVLGGKRDSDRLKDRLLRAFAASLGTTFSALVFTVPLTALHFGKISLIAPISNFIVLWVVSLIFILGLLTGVMGAVVLALGMPIVPATEVLITLTVGLPVRFLRWAVLTLARIPFASLAMDELYSRLWLILLYAVFAYVLFAPGRKRPWVIASVCILTLTASFTCSILTLRAGEITVQALDVGQGQSVLIRSGDSFVLCDCGGDGASDVGYTAAEHLERAGSRTLQMLILSHFDADHVNGVKTLLELVDVKLLALPDEEPESPQRRAILDQAAQMEIPVRFIRMQEQFALDGDTVITVLPPPDGGKDSNDRGLTILCTCGEYDVLMTGDLGQTMEKTLLRTGSLPDVELMIAGHHGSRYSNSQVLLDAVRPEKVIISVGAYNSYGHPARETLDRFEQVGAQVFRTDQMGTVTIQEWPHRE